MKNEPSRRDLLLKGSFVIGVAAVGLGGIDRMGRSGNKEPEVSATEDLMREHGVIRRALLVYTELAQSLRKSPDRVNAAALHKTAQLFRTFGEDYHERMLEEKHIFPIVRKMKGEAAKYPDILVEQHQRGREITEYTLAVTAGSKISVQHGEGLATALEGLVLMYENHAAREDTIVFPAWKKNFSTSNWMSFPSNLKISSTRCSARMALKMPRRPSALSKNHLDSRIFRISPPHRHRNPSRQPAQRPP